MTRKNDRPTHAEFLVACELKHVRDQRHAWQRTAEDAQEERDEALRLLGVAVTADRTVWEADAHRLLRAASDREARYSDG